MCGKDLAKTLILESWGGVEPFGSDMLDDVKLSNGSRWGDKLDDLKA